MKIIGLEEHFHTPQILAALKRANDDTMLLFQDKESQARLLDLGEGRLRQMDLIGLDRMVLSVTTPATQALPPTEAVPLARQANDQLAAAIRAHPDRFSGFATLPTPDPAAAVRELRRGVQELGFCGAMLHGRTGDKYLDHPDCWPRSPRSGCPCTCTRRCRPAPCVPCTTKASGRSLTTCLPPAAGAGTSTRASGRYA